MPLRKNVQINDIKLKAASSPTLESSPLSEKLKSSPYNTPNSSIASPLGSDVDVIGNEKYFDFDQSSVLTPNNSKKKIAANKAKCPCGKSDKSSTYITCSSCKQGWHNKCCNCRDLDQLTIKKLVHWECPACYVCPILSKAPASLYAEIQTMRETMSTFAIRDSQISASLHTELNQLKDVVAANSESNLSSRIDVLQNEIKDLKDAVCGDRDVNNLPSTCPTIQKVTTELPQSVQSIQTSLAELSQQMSNLQTSVAKKSAPSPSARPPTLHLPNTASPHYNQADTPCKAYESYETEVVPVELKAEIMDFIKENEGEFISADSDNSRELLYFGEYSYKYTGKELKAKPPPAVLMKVLDAVDPKTGDCRTIKANSCLITRYRSGDNHIPMHRDDEPIIDPDSHILTVSFGSSRTMTFKNNDDSQTETLNLEDCSLLVTSRYAQDYWKHGILPEEGLSSERISLTFREIAPQYLNSTIILGDSNTSKISFGTGSGTMGAWVPGKRVKVGHIEALPDAADIGPYRNIVIHTGINSINTRYERKSDAFLIHHLESKCKEYMRVYPRSKIHLSMLLPTRQRHLNDHVNHFNRALLDMSYRHKNISIIDNSIFGGYLSDEHGRWNVSEQRPLVSDILHLGRQGIRMFAMNIKSAVIGKGSSQSRARFNSSQGRYRGALGRSRHHSAPRTLP